jgi:hypothetical protein
MLGIDPAKLGGRRQLPPNASDIIPIWPDMVDGYALFCSMATQWNWVPLSQGGAFQSGLKYETIPVVAAGIGINWPPPAHVFSDLRTLEGEALKLWSAKR